MTDAKPVDVGALVAELVSIHKETVEKLGLGASDVYWRVKDALLALQAENEQIKRDAATSLSLSNSTLADVIADRDRLTQENARLAGEVYALRMFGNKDCTAQADEYLAQGGPPR